MSRQISHGSIHAAGHLAGMPMTGNTHDTAACPLNVLQEMSVQTVIEMLSIAYPL